MRKKLVSLLLGIGFFLMVYLSPTCQASSLLFEAKVIPPANQEDKTLPYFDLKVTPSQSQRIEVLLTNFSSTDIQVSSQVFSAETSPSGNIVYGSHQKSVAAKGETPDIRELVSIEEDSLVIPKHSQKKLKVAVQIPAEKFEGMVLGSLFMKQLDLTEKQVATSQTQLVTHQFGYNLGLVLREDTTPVVSELVLDQAQFSSTKQALEVTMTNPKSKVMKTSQTDYKLFKEDEITEEPLVSYQAGQIAFAPNSTYTGQIPLKENLTPGKYHLVAEVKEGEHIWKFDKEFQVVKEKVAASPKKIVNKLAKKNPTPSKLLGNGLISLLLGLCGIFLGIYSYYWLKYGRKGGRSR
ncbi:DUF916 domain-containing protein [Vagococcus humatus]|uniref:Uncharacterized protein n=1 Tax=Vagococcus humatus TaxID=1889241 RepID=A0A429Z863_9ENTE|nr:DUF916 domain-containing protein [Vagococcus humatus]RST89863.1 hypothetical protein C7P63_01940 [Vagococcus humatus]